MTDHGDDYDDYDDEATSDEHLDDAWYEAQEERARQAIARAGLRPGDVLVAPDGARGVVLVIDAIGQAHVDWQTDDWRQGVSVMDVEAAAELRQR